VDVTNDGLTFVEDIDDDDDDDEAVSATCR